MRVVIICPAVRGAMGYHLQAIARHYPVAEELTLYVPATFHSKELPCRVVRYPISQRALSKSVAYLSWAWARRRFSEIRHLGVDVFHLFNSDGYLSSWFWARWVRCELRKPFIVSVHDPEPHPGSWMNLVFHWIGRQTQRQASHVHIFSDYFVPRMRAFGIPMERLFVIPLCTDISNFTRHMQSGVAREPLVLFFGRMEAYKGLPVLVEAAEQLEGKLRFALAGPGRLPRSLKQRILAKPHLFELYNYFVPEPEVARLFQRASVCVMPYTQATQSSVPWIAAAFGVPVVATATGGIESQVRQINGVIVPPNDSRALAQGILEAMGREVRLPEEWHPTVVARQYRAMYQRVHAEGCL
ncbi:MAG: glycosyltransferase [Armatimonadota bacterium]|nr:glycosyltransferase [Armatimonadota bacterium]